MASNNQSFYVCEQEKEMHGRGHRFRKDNELRLGACPYCGSKVIKINGLDVSTFDKFYGVKIPKEKLNFNSGIKGGYKKTNRKSKKLSKHKTRKQKKSK